MLSTLLYLAIAKKLDITYPIDLHIFTHMRPYSLELRKKVIAKLAESYSVRQVTNNFGIHFPTVQKWKMHDCL